MVKSHRRLLWLSFQPVVDVPTPAAPEYSEESLQKLPVSNTACARLL